jgi:hypothetical protein
MGQSPRSGRKPYEETLRHDVEDESGFIKSANRDFCRPLRRLTNPFASDPGACTPGFMLSPAPRAFFGVPCDR